MGRATTPPAIEVSDVTFSYGETTIIDRVSFQVEEGEFLSLIGPSGCGKSTLLAMMDGVLEPDSGTVLIEGRTPNTGEGSRATVFQGFALMPWKTVLDNVALGLRYKRPDLSRTERADIAMEYLEKVGLASSARRYPRHLSGGMQQRVGLARAFAVQPRLLLMDEPFGALDAQNAEVLRDEVQALVEQEGRSVILVTHNLDEALQLSSRVLLMSAGPSTIRDDVSVELPSRDSPHYAARYDEYRTRLWSHLRDEVETTRARERNAV